ncbi:DUF4430 domain-containing protein [Sporosarcina sp. NPDC096371]|uniref:DUF4430 domain-containing protein n=1 Tax=Sporosarcina sp. NPDC096371 TaxID=3364530 RepID=UPI0037FACA5C
MKSHVKLFALLLAIFMMLSACGTSWQKPTGLEKPENGQQEIPNEGQSDEQQESVELDVTESQEDEEVKEIEDVKVEQEKPVVKVEKAKETSATNNEQEKNKTATIEQPKNKPVEPERVVNKQPTQPVPEEKKPVVTTPAPTAPPSTPSKTPPAEKPVEKEEQPEPKGDTIVYSIVISSTEVPLPATEMEITDGDTVLKALIAITKDKKIQMDYRGGQGGTAYIEGINNVYEFDRGQGSGWMYRVNGIFPDRGAGVVPLVAGDRVEWIYTTNLGVDIGADLKPFRR